MAIEQTGTPKPQRFKRGVAHILFWQDLEHGVVDNEIFVVLNV